jgi:hypothetical protein
MIDVNELHEHWCNEPPLPLMVRAYLGIGGEKKKPKRASKESLAELAKMLGG